MQGLNRSMYYPYSGKYYFLDGQTDRQNSTGISYDSSFAPVHGIVGIMQPANNLSIFRKTFVRTFVRTCVKLINFI